MKKTLKKFMISMVGICFLLSLAPTLTKAETIESTTEKDNVLFTVDVKNENELNDFLKELDRNNKNSQILWAKALKEEQSQNINKDSGYIQTRDYTSSCTATKSIMQPNGRWARIGAYAYFNVIWGGSSNVFGTVSQMYFYGQDSDTTISNSYISTKLLDGRRTLAISGSFLVGVKTSSGSIQYYPIDTYLEMYVSGGSWWP